MWNRRVEFGLFDAVASVFRHLHPKMAHLEVPQDRGVGTNRTGKNSRSNWPASIAGWRKAGLFQAPDYSIADITALVAIDFMKPAGLGTPDTFENVLRWHREVSARPSAGGRTKDQSPFGCFECYVSFQPAGRIDRPRIRPLLRAGNAGSQSRFYDHRKKILNIRLTLAN